MKKLMIATLFLAGFSVAGIAQSTPAPKKGEPAKMQVVKKTGDKKDEGKVVKMNTTTTKTVATTPTTPKVATTTPVKKAPVTTTTAASGPAKKDGTPDMRYKSNQGTTTGPLKKDGTKDMRYKANKKH